MIPCTRSSMVNAWRCRRWRSIRPYSRPALVISSRPTVRVKKRARRWWRAFSKCRWRRIVVDGRMSLSFPYETWPKNKALSWTQNAWDVVPDLAVEVVSPSDQLSEMVEKIDEFFLAGVKQVWVVHPNQYRIYVYDTPTQIRVLERKDSLDGEVLPGFVLPLADLFREETGT